MIDTASLSGMLLDAIGVVFAVGVVVLAASLVSDYLKFLKRYHRGQ
jgi:hypothetical protein